MEDPSFPFLEDEFKYPLFKIPYRLAYINQFPPQCELGEPNPLLPFFKDNEVFLDVMPTHQEDKIPPSEANQMITSQENDCLGIKETFQIPKPVIISEKIIPKKTLIKSKHPTSHKIKKVTIAKCAKSSSKSSTRNLEEETERKKKRLERNRKSARESRLKKKENIKRLENEVIEEFMVECGAS